MISPDFNFVESLLHQYGEPHRKFHTAEHLRHLFMGLRDFKAFYDKQENQGVELDLDLMNWCICFHDWIYTPGDPDNEEKSADLSFGYLVRFGYARLDSVHQIILATKDHEVVVAPEISTHVGFHKALMLDLDLSGLGIPRDEYARTSGELKEEYSSVFTFKVFDEGRRKWDKEMLARKSIFSLPYFRDKYEAQARDNLLRESM